VEQRAVSMALFHIQFYFRTRHCRAYGTFAIIFGEAKVCGCSNSIMCQFYPCARHCGVIEGGNVYADPKYIIQQLLIIIMPMPPVNMYVEICTCVADINTCTNIYVCV